MESQSNINEDDQNINIATSSVRKQSNQENNSCQSFKKLLANTEELTRLIWGSNLKDEVFDRWSQGTLL
jgi:hypothetical protein